MYNVTLLLSFHCQIVSSNATITDIDSTLVGQLIVSTSSNLEYLTWSDLPGISYNNTQGVVTFIGLQPISVYEELIRSFTFVDLSNEPSLEPRVVLFQVFTSVDGNGELSASNVAQSTITIVPVNDMPPVFDQASYQGFVNENRSPGFPVSVTVQATDTDALSDATITYSILGGSDYFMVDASTGVVTTTAMLDAEMLSNAITFTVIAKESSSEFNLTSTVPVTVAIRDVNDNAPQFEESLYNVAVLEDTLVGATLLTVQATDSDVSSENSEFRYYLAENGTEFDESSGGAEESLDNVMTISISVTTGEITLKEVLDFEAAQELAFYVVAIDFGSPPLTSSVPLVIEVVDVNDNAPVLESVYEATPLESVATGTVIAIITAQDADTETVLSFSLSGSGSEDFEINMISGEVSVARALDYEITSTYSLIVSVTDGVHSVSSLLKVMLVNVNDNPPMIGESFNFSVPENVDFELLINATDADGDVLEYSIIGGTGQCDLLSIFVMNGRIYNTEKFDRELQEVCWLVVQVSDGVSNVTSNVTIYIVDENDNIPIFDEAVYSVDVFDRLLEDKFVVQVFASDADNDAILYSIVSQSEQLFKISETSGVITNTLHLSRASERQYNVTVGAKNSNDDIMSTALVMINLIDTVLPSVSLSQPPPAYVEESGLASVASNLIVVGRGDIPLLGARIRLTAPSCLGSSACQDVQHNDLQCVEYCGEALAINATAATDLSIAIDADNYTINIIGSASTQDYQNVLSTLGYININSEPTSATQFAIYVYDDLVSSYKLCVDLNISYVDDNCPVVLATVTDSLTFVENSSPLAVGAVTGVTVSDDDVTESHQVLSSLVVNISGLVDGLDESIDVLSTDTVSATTTRPSPNTSVITLTGQASIAAFQDILQSLTYVNTRSEPTPGPRTLTLTPSHDGGLNCSSLELYLTVELSNDNAPVVTVNSSSIIYEEGSGAVLFGQLVNLMITDDDENTLLQSATVSLEGNTDALEGLSVLVDSPITIDSNKTVISISGQGSTSLYQTILRAVSYSNPTSNPTPGNRTISIVVYDGQHNAVTVVLVMVVRANDSPLVLASNIARFSFVEGNTSVMLDTVTISDEDENAFVYNLSISLGSLEQGKERISVTAFESVIISDPALIDINQPALIDDYQVCTIVLCIYDIKFVIIAPRSYCHH